MRQQQRIRKRQPKQLLHQLYAEYRYRAKKKRYPFLLTKEEFVTLSQQRCTYCGVKPRPVRNNGRVIWNRQQLFKFNGVDRVNNTRGYVKGNCVPCCFRCNMAKGILTLTQFKGWLRRAYRYSIERKR